jgi:hypothetical protein
MLLLLLLRHWHACGSPEGLPGIAGCLKGRVALLHVGRHAGWRRHLLLLLLPLPLLLLEGGLLGSCCCCCSLPGSSLVCLHSNDSNDMY